MNSSRQQIRQAHIHGRSRAFALVLIFALLAQAAPVFAQTATAKSSGKRMGEEQRILHVLNRLGFGARPGDVERVRKLGVERYIAAQLDPARIDDWAVEAKLRDLPSLRMTTAEIYAKYPQPNKLLRELERRGELPDELKGLRENRVKRDAPMDEKASGEKAAGDAAQGVGRDEYRRRINAYYAENNLQQPQRLVAELQASRILRAAYSERQLQEVMVDFWTNHFNVFSGKSADKWLLTAYDRDTLRPNALGKFRDLLLATAQSPAMLFYLDNFQSVSPNAAGGYRKRDGQARRGAINERRQERRRLGQRRAADTGAMNEEGAAMAAQPSQQPPAMMRRKKQPKRGINENYARELMELHTLGVDGGYTQADIVNVARAFTGWTIIDPRGYSGFGGDAVGSFTFNPRLHDDGEKIVLGQRIPAGGGVQDGLKVIEILSRHPSTARFIAIKLARRFVADDPSPTLVARVAETFTRTDGDIKETLRAIFTSAEFNSAEAYRTKIKTPFELTVSAIRALDAETDARPALLQQLVRMGEPLYGYQAPTGYPDTAAAWVSTGALLERLNFALALSANRIPGTRVDVGKFIGTNVTLSDAQGKERALDSLLNTILHAQVSPGTRSTLLRQITNPTPTKTIVSAANGTAGMSDDEMTARKNRRARRGEMNAQARGMSANETELRRIVGLIIGAPEFQRQ